MNVTRLRAAGKRGERGSALLIVFVFAAMVAIMLYMEMPVAMFEAQRQKEQLLIDRGNEYAHAVKLYVRKLGTYPASMDALEKTNQMRFLRHRFKDPFTGKDDWRILHAGPNGMLIDSKVKQTGTGLGANGTNAARAQNGSNGNGIFGSSSNGGSFSNNASSAFGSSSGTSGSSFGNSSANGGMGSFGSGSNTDTTPPEMVIKRPPQRGPEMAVNGSGQAAASPGGDQDPLAPLLPPDSTDTSQVPGAGTSSSGTPGQSGAPGQAVGGQAGQNATPGGIGSTSPQRIGANGTGSSMGTMGTLNSGGIAGVASKAAGHSIKVVNDQTDYSLWEFYYDPTKDATKGISSALGAMGAGQQANQQQNGMTPFGSNNSSGTSSPFSNNNSFGSSNSFGSNSGNSGSTNTSPTSPAPPSSTMPPPQ